MEASSAYPFPFLRPYAVEEDLLIPRTLVADRWQTYYEAPARPALVLLSGAAQSGKTSWVQAALPALLPDQAAILHLKAASISELRLAVQEALEGDAFVELPELWRETETSGPLWLVIDAATPESDFWDELKALVTSENFAPKGGIVVVTRQTALGEVEEKLPEEAFAKLFFPLPAKSEIAEGLTGWAESEDWQTRYGITLEKLLPGMLAAEIAEGQHADPLFALQSLMLRFWERTIGAGVPRPVWSGSLFKKIRAEGLTPTDFARQQWVALQEAHPKAATSGALIELLGTMGQQPVVERSWVRKQFGHLSPPPEPILESAAQRHLLQENARESLRWKHPDFAATFRNIQQRSERPAQVARRLLEAKLQSKPPIYFSREELNLLRDTEAHIRLRTPEENLHIKTSERKLRKQSRKRRRWKFVAYFLFLVLLLAGAGGYLQWQQYQDEQSRARSQSQRLRTEFLAFITQNLHDEAPTTAVRLAEANEAITPLPPPARRALHTAFLNEAVFHTATGRAKNIRQTGLSADGKQLAYLSERGQAALYERDGTLLWQYEDEARLATALHLHGRQVLLGTQTGEVLVFQAEQTDPLQRIAAHPQAVVALQTDTTGRLLTVGQEGEVKLWRLADGSQQHILPIDLPFAAAKLRQVAFSEAGVLLQSDSTTIFWNPKDTTRLDPFLWAGDRADFIPEGILLHDSLGWGIRQDSLSTQRPEAWREQRIVRRLPADSGFLLVGENNLVQLPDNRTLQTEGEVIRRVWLSEQRIVLGSETGRFLVFDTEGKPLGTFQGNLEQESQLAGTYFLKPETNQWALLMLADKAVADFAPQDQLAFAPDESRYVVYEPDSARLYAYRLPENTLLDSLRLPAVPSDNPELRFLPDGRHVLLGHSRCWDTQTGQLLVTETSATFSDDADRHLIPQTEGKFFLNDTAGVPQAVLHGEKAFFVPLRDSVWTLTPERLTLWNPQGDTVLAKAGNFIGAYPSPDGTHLMLTEDRQNFTLYRIAEGGLSEVRSYRLGVPVVPEIAADNQKVLFRRYNADSKAPKELLTWFVGEEERRPPKSYVRGNLTELRPTSDGKYVLAANATHADLFDWQGERRGSVTGRFVQYLPTENLLLTVRPNQFLLGDAFQPGTLLSREVPGLRTVRFSPKGNWIAFNQDGYLQIFPISPQEVGRWLDTHQIARLSAEERRQFMLDER